jgi:NAD-dependent DNA ligase
MSHHIVYRDASGAINYFDIAEISHTETYIQAIHDGHLKTFRRDRILEWLPDAANANERLTYWRNNPPPEPEKPAAPQPLDVCFTGFAKTDKARLKQTATAAGLVVRADVTQHLHILCCGANAGPSKSRHAREVGALSLTEAQFLVLLETGELPDS